MSVRLITLSAATALMVCACATSQENPNYKYSTKYKGAFPYATQSATVTQTQPAVQSAQYVQTQPAAPVTYQYQPVQAATQTYATTNHACLRKEKNREILGGAVGGTVGAIAGKKLIGGTKGTVIGAAVGGTAGYGIGDKSINCDPIQVAVPQPYVQPATSQTYYNNSGQQYVATAPAQPVYAAPTDQAYGATYGTPGYHAVMAAETNPQPVQMVPVQPQPAPAPVYTQPQIQAVTPVSTPTPQQYTNAQVAYHEVVEGDTVYSLSKRQCVSIEDIQRLNNIDGTFNIRLGDYIQLPASRC